MSPAEVRNRDNQGLLLSQDRVCPSRRVLHQEVEGNPLILVWLTTPLCAFVVVVTVDSWFKTEAGNSQSISLEQMKNLVFVRCYAYATDATWVKVNRELEDGRIYLP